MLRAIYDEYLDYPLGTGSGIVLLLATIVCSFFNVQLTILLTVLLMTVPPLIFQRKYNKSFTESLNLNLIFCAPLVITCLQGKLNILNHNDFKHNGGWVYSAKVDKIVTGYKTKSVEVECVDLQGNTIKETIDTYYERNESPYVLLAKTSNVINSSIVLERHISETDYNTFRKGKFVTNDDYKNPQLEADSQYAQKMINRYTQNNENLIFDNKIMVWSILIVAYLLFTWITGIKNIYLFSIPIISIAAMQCYTHCYFYNIELLAPWLIMWFAVTQLKGIIIGFVEKYLR